MNPNDEPDLGSCCICEGTTGVRNIVMINKLAPVPGTGWGCLQCGLPMNGAVAVLCDACLERMRHDEPLKFAVSGMATEHGRVPYADLTGEFDHDMSKHPEVEEIG